MGTLHFPGHLHLLPVTHLGKTALRVASGAILTLVVISFLATADMATGFWIGIPGLAALFCLVAAGIASLFAIITRGERSILAFLLVFTGALPLMFLLGEATSQR